MVDFIRQLFLLHLLNMITSRQKTQHFWFYRLVPYHRLIFSVCMVNCATICNFTLWLLLRSLIWLCKIQKQHKDVFYKYFSDHCGDCVFFWCCFMLEQIGAGFGMLMGLVLWFGMPTFSRLFTKDSMVLEIVASLTPVSVVTCLFRCPGFQG